MNEQYFYSSGLKQNGPVTLEALRALGARGELKRTDKIWKQGMPSWERAGAISEVFDGLPPDLACDAWGTKPPPLKNSTDENTEILHPKSESQASKFMLESRMAFIVAYPIGIAFGIYAGINDDAAVPSVLALLFLGIAIVYWMNIHYRCWKLIPPDIASTTPGKAVGYYFIPLFNLYWMFVTFNRLAKDANRTLDRLNVDGHRCNEQLSLGFAAVQACMCSIAGVIPVLGVCLIGASYVLWLIYYADLSEAFAIIRKHAPQKF